MPTLRQQMAERLRAAPQTPRDLAEAFGLKVRDVVGHLEHLRRSFGREFEVQAAECKGCDFVFEARTKLSVPSRCPRCRGQRIRAPLTRIRESGAG